MVEFAAAIDNFLGIGVSPSHLPIYSCSSFQPPESTRDNQQNGKKKKRDFPSEDSRPDQHQLSSCQTSAWCNSVNKSNLQFSRHTFIYKQSVGNLTLAEFLKHGYNSSKTAGFPLHLFENSSLEVSEKRRNRSNTSTGARPDGKVSFLTREGDNPMTLSDFDWMVSNHAVWGWKAPVT